MRNTATRTDPTDDELLARFVAGDGAALGQLFLRHRESAYRVAYRLLGDQDDALDAVQNGFQNVLQHGQRFEGKSSFRTWLLRVVYHAALDVGRARGRRLRRVNPTEPTVLAHVVDHRPDPTDGLLEHQELRNRLDEALRALSDSQRAVFVLCVDGEMSYQSVAETLNMPIGTVMSRLFYARQKLKTLLADVMKP